MNLQWYPGHMTKAKRQMQEDLKLIDLIIELVDARIPLSSRNPDIDELGKNKARLILLNKSDLADERYNEQWSAYFQKKGFYVVKVNAKSGAGLKSIQGVIQEACKAKIERDRRRGIKNRPIRAMVVGIPRYAGYSVAEVRGSGSGKTSGIYRIYQGRDPESGGIVSGTAGLYPYKLSGAAKYPLRYRGRGHTGISAGSSSR